MILEEEFASAPITSVENGKSSLASLPNVADVDEPSTAAKSAKRVLGLSTATGVLPPPDDTLSPTLGTSIEPTRLPQNNGVSYINV